MLNKAERYILWGQVRGGAFQAISTTPFEFQDFAGICFNSHKIKRWQHYTKLLKVKQNKVSTGNIKKIVLVLVKNK